MKLLIHLSVFLVLMAGFFSCDRIQNKAEQLAKEVKEKATNELEVQTQRIADKVSPPFDYDTADTENNKKRFLDFLKVEISPDVKNIYCFDDAIGIDADYMFAFNCNNQTSKKIIEVHHLSIDTIDTDNGLGMQNDFAWWDKNKIEQLTKYSWTNGQQYYKYYWYDIVNQKAYFFDFDK